MNEQQIKSAVATAKYISESYGPRWGEAANKSIVLVAKALLSLSSQLEKAEQTVATMELIFGVVRKAGLDLQLSAHQCDLGLEKARDYFSSKGGAE